MMVAASPSVLYSAQGKSDSVGKSVDDKEIIELADKYIMDGVPKCFNNIKRVTWFKTKEVQYWHLYIDTS